MKSLMSSDIYKLYKGKYLYACSIAAMLLRISVIVITYFVSDMMEGYEITGYTLLAESIGSSGAMLTAIAISIFVGGEFAFGTIKNSATKAFSRTRIYMSKLLVSFFATIFILVISAIVYVVLGAVLFGWGTPPDGYIVDALIIIGMHLYLNLALSAVFVMIAILIRQSGGSIAINICILQFTGLFVELFRVLMNRVFSVSIEFSKYLPTTIISDFMTAEEITSELLIRGFTVGAVIIVLSTAFGIFSLQKRDIK